MFPYRSRVVRTLFILMSLTTTIWREEAGAAQLTASWSDSANDQTGFYIERANGTTGTFARIATTAATVMSYMDTSATGGATYCYRVQAYNSAGTSGYTNTACGTALTDTQAPTVSLTAPAGGSTVSGSSVTVSALASDNVGVAGVQFQLDGVNIGSEDATSPYSITWNTTIATNGSHNLTAVARDAAGNTTTSTVMNVTVSNTTSPPPPGLVAAYGFNEGTGTSVADASGNGNTGVISGATWAGGKFGQALSFNGSTALVTVNDSASLDLTTGMTLEAWVYPTSLGGWRDLIYKGSNDIYYLEGSSSQNNVPAMGGTYAASPLYGTSTAPLNTWSHLTATYDGATRRLYINGVQVASQAQTGSIQTSTGALTMGGDTLYGQYWAGLIDDVRIYNRALSVAEIQTDMSTSVGSTSPPTTYALTVTKAGTGSGAISSSPAGISCGAACTASYNSGTTVTLTAAPASGSTFTGWSGACSGTGACTVTMNGAASVTATFTTQTYALTVTKGGTGSGAVSSSPAGINCGATCTTSYNSGTAVLLTAAPASGSTFTGWSGACSGTGACTVTMNGAASVTATFTTQTYALTVTKGGTSSGAVSSSPAGINCGATCTASYNSGTIVTLTAAPAAGSTFAGWSGGACSGTGSCSVTVSAAASVTATFTGQMNVKIGVFRPSTGQWFLDVNGNGLMDDCQSNGCPTFGQSGDKPVVGDWNGTGTIKLGVYTPGTHQWKLDLNGNDQWEGCTVDQCVNIAWYSTDLPVVGRWTTASLADRVGIYRPSKKYWRLDLNGNGVWDGCTTDGCWGFGSLSGLPVAGDWSGNGTDKVGVFIPSTGLWKLDRNGNGVLDACTTDGCLGPFGVSADQPVAGDWDGKGTAKIGVFDPTTGLWELDLNGNGVFDGCAVDTCLGPFGQSGDIPVVGKW